MTGPLLAVETHHPSAAGVTHDDLPNKPTQIIRVFQFIILQHMKVDRINVQQPNDKLKIFRSNIYV